ncbi:phage tail protein [Epilithonimonas zeae]|uniref:Microcystin-dependent protein n=1 Tax=Epilithonimonas zeae TaxID=1416779 RepID=A0A1N6G7S2_9FLAO|nr:tail fiber protein [Epilithonimonas zeae]SIO03575.1 Microcystin-dependent protein [Epilithonimonas zeae]
MKKFKLLIIGAFMITVKISAQSEPFVGQIMFVPYNFAPVGWRDCDGSILSIAEYSTLFQLIGTTYGGNGQTTFALPDMRGRVVIDDGNGAGLSPYVLGQKGGTETVTLTVNQMPSHTHNVVGSNLNGNSSSPTNAVPANTRILDPEYSDATSDTTMKTNTVSNNGGSQPHNNMMPTTAMKCVIATEGIFPSQN